MEQVTTVMIVTAHITTVSDRSLVFTIWRPYVPHLISGYLQ